MMVSLEGCGSILLLLTLGGRDQQEDRVQMMLILLLWRVRDLLNVASQPYMLPEYIFLTHNISIDSQLILDLLLGRTPIILHHSHVMLLSSQRHPLPRFLELDLHILVLPLLREYHDVSLN